jgi:hypothetical protein
MTLICCFHNKGCRALLADILISSKTAGDRDLVLPTRVYIPPDRLHSISWKPAAFRRKVIEVSPDLVMLWAGQYEKARELARRAEEWFGPDSQSHEDVRQFLHAHYRTQDPYLHAIIASAHKDWLYVLGHVETAESTLCGQYAVAGSGAKLFRAIADEARHREVDTVTPDLTGLWLASDLMAREITAAETIYSGFGAGYEVLYRDVRGFKRIDDVVHVFSRIEIDNFDESGFALYPHLIRQWYEEDRLYIASLSLTDEAEQGLGSKGFIVPSILGQESLPTRPIEDLAKRPDYLVIHHRFKSQEPRRSFALTLRGTSIDRYFRLSNDSASIRFEFTASYIQALRGHCEKLQRFYH